MREEQSKKWRGSGCLFLASLIWGMAFAAQRAGMDHLGPFAFNAIRNLLGSLVLLPCIFLLKKIRKDTSGKTDRKLLLQGGLVCGFFLAIASNLQQIGIKYTSVGKAGFITALYIVLVPVLGIFIHRKAGRRVWLSVVLAVAGLYLLCMTERLQIGRGDRYVLLCALAFAFQILAVDHFAGLVDGVKLACLEFLVCGLLSLIPMALTETPTWQQVWGARYPLLFAGCLSSGIAYTLQILGQRDLPPAVASLIMSFESVISVLAGWLFLHQTLSLRELIGCGIMFAAVILAQL